MRKSGLGVVFLLLAASSPTNASNSPNTSNTNAGNTNSKICGMASGSTLVTFQDSVSEIHDHVSTVLATGLIDLYSLPNVQAWIEDAKPTRLCVSTLALGKNIYQYDEILAVLDLWDSHGKEWVTPMVFQTASVQAHENIGPKPWVGLGRKDFVTAVQHALEGVQYQDAGSILGPDFSPLRFFAIDGQSVPKPGVSSVGASTSADPQSQGYVLVPGVDPAWTTYLVTRLRTLDTGNPFTSQVLTDLGVVQVQESTGKARWARVMDFFDLYTRLEQFQSSARPSVDSPELDLATLRELSR